MTRATSYSDRFVVDRLPPEDQWPRLVLDRPWLQYPERLNAASMLLEGAHEDPRAQRPLFVSGGRTWTYADVAEAADRAAAVLTYDLELQPGNRLLLRGPNSPMLCILWLAAIKAGLVVVTTMPMLRERELAQLIDQAQVGVMLCDARVAECVEAARELAPVCTRVMTFGTPSSEFETRMGRRSGVYSDHPSLAVDPAIIAFTSGTTGRPKGTIHFHRDLMAVADTFPRWVLDTSEADRFLCSAPLGFTYGLGGHLLFPMRYGASAVLLENAAPDGFLEAIGLFEPTILMTAPTAYRAMLSHKPDLHVPSVRLAVSAGEHLSTDTFERWERATGLRIVNGIGATELLHIFASSPPDEVRPGSTGRALPGYEVRVIGDDLEPLPPGQVGQLAVRGPTGCRYLDDPRQTTYVRDGWNLTGDAYSADAENYLYYHSRADDMIVSSGYNIAGPEVEEAVLRHPAVLECAVVGVPDRERGMLVKAFVRLRKPEAASDGLAADLQNFVKQTIAPFKYPRAIEFVDALPRNASGKIQRFVLREREAQLAAMSGGS